MLLRIERPSPEGSLAAISGLVQVLEDAVVGGASVGFLSPLGEGEAETYWRGVAGDIEQGSRILLLAWAGDELAGTAQLELAGKPNAAHRAEVQKLLVLTALRRRGVGRRLMEALEDEARAAGRSLLVLDTRQGDSAERLYRRLGYVEAGSIPGYARSSMGTLDATVFFYKQLD